jgi:filamentous hemagglutinin
MKIHPSVQNKYLACTKNLRLQKKTGDDTQDIFEKYADISRKYREQVVAQDCSNNLFCVNAALEEMTAGNAIANSLNRFPVSSGLNSEELSQLNRFVLAENEVTASAIYQAMPVSVKVALSVKDATDALGLGAAVGGKPLAALGVIGKGSPLPAPTAIVATNGLLYKSNPKHTPGQSSNRPNAGIEPKESLKLFEQSIQSSKQYPNKEVRFALDSKGDVHRFEGTIGEYRWNGSSGDAKNKLTDKQIPSDIQKKLGVSLK